MTIGRWQFLRVPFRFKAGRKRGQESYFVEQVIHIGPLLIIEWTGARYARG